jgi:hypothetical protein
MPIAARHFRRKAIAAALAALFPAAATANVARVDFAVGNVTAVSADGHSRPLAKGSQIEVGDTVNTQQGRAQLRFQDGAYMSLLPETSFKIEEFRFTEKGQGADRIVMNLLRGGMRTITGLIGRANRQNYRFRTAVATIGIRGTEYSVRYTNSIEVFCAEGSIFVQNEGGSLPLNSGEGARVLSAQAAPTKTDEPPVLSPAGSPTTLQLEDPVNPIQEALPPVAVPVGKFAGSWAASHLNLSGVNAATGVSIELDGSSSLQAFDGGGGTNLLNTSTASLDGSDGLISWGRWTNGTIGGTGLYGGKDTRAAPLHWVAGLSTPNMPTGSASYSMIGATVPSCTPTCSATLNSSSLFVSFDTSKADLHIDITIAGTNYATTSPIPLGLSGSSFSGGGTMPGGVCGSASLAAQGFFSGDAAARAGLAYHVGTGFENVNGAIAYKNSGLSQ